MPHFERLDFLFSDPLSKKANENVVGSPSLMSGPIPINYGNDPLNGMQLGANSEFNQVYCLSRHVVPLYNSMLEKLMFCIQFASKS
jgi:hypothetical protein